MPKFRMRGLQKACPEKIPPGLRYQELVVCFFMLLAVMADTASFIKNDIFAGLSTKDDMYRISRDREAKFPIVEFRSPQLSYRLELVDWISMICCEKFGLSRATKHLAVLLVDGFMDNYVVDRSQFHLMALSCVQLAGILLLLRANILKRCYVKLEYTHLLSNSAACKKQMQSKRNLLIWNFSRNVFSE